MVRTQLSEGIVLHGLNLDELDVDASCEDSPGERIKRLLKSIFHHYRFEIHRFSYGEKAVIAAGSEENWHRIELNFPRFSILPFQFDI